MRNIHGFTYELRREVLETLTAGITGCGGWVVERRAVTASTLRFRVEVQLSSALDFYAAIASAGVELSQSAHEIMTGLCMRCMHRQLSADLVEVVEVDLEINFLDEYVLNSLLCTGCAVA